MFILAASTCFGVLLEGNRRKRKMMRKAEEKARIKRAKAQKQEELGKIEIIPNINIPKMRFVTLLSTKL